MTQLNKVKNFIIVMIVWAAMFIADIILVQTYGTKTMPQSDELWLLKDSGKGIDFHWLWKPWAEHRDPIAKLIWKSVLMLTDYNFRTGCFLTVIVLAGIALALILTARRMRGRSIIADAFFPLALLNFGQVHVFLIWWQINHVLAPALASVVLMLLVLYSKNLKLRNAALITAGLILLALSGPAGLPYALAIAGWLCLWGLKKWPTFTSQQKRLFVRILAGVVFALLLLGLYFVNYVPFYPGSNPTSMSTWPESPGSWAVFTTYLQILALSLGTATKSYSLLYGIAVLSFALITVFLLVKSLRIKPSERWNVSALLFLLSAQAALVFVIASSRAGMGIDYIYLGHYLTHMAPALCTIYFAWEMLDGRSGQIVQTGMMLMLVLLIPKNIKDARLEGHSLQNTTAKLERDVRDGVPVSIIAEHHFTNDVVPLPDTITDILRTLKAGRIGIFKEIADDPAWQKHNLPLESAALMGMDLHGRIFSPKAGWEGNRGMTFILPVPEHVYAVRMRYGYVRSASLSPTLFIFWRKSAEQNFTDTVAKASERVYSVTVSGPDQPVWALVDGKINVDAKIRTDRVLTVWIDRTIDQLRIYPDIRPCEFRLTAIELFVPPNQVNENH